MIPDINLLVYAYDQDSPFHDDSRRWWEGLMNGLERVGLPWVVATGFIRVITSARPLRRPPPVGIAVEIVQEWFRFPHIVAINPGAAHLTLLQQNLTAAGVGGNLVTDAHIAALAIEYQAEVHSNDLDFGRFPGLRWRNPLR